MSKQAQTAGERDEQLRRSFDMAFRSVTSLPDEIVERIRSRILKNLEEGRGSTEKVLRAIIQEEIEGLGEMDPVSLRKAIRKIWDETKRDLQRVIRSESINAYSRVQLKEWADRGIKRVRRKSIDDDRTCAICRELSRPGTNIYDIEALLRLDYPVSQDPDTGEWMTHPNCFLPGTLVRGDFVAGSRAIYNGPAREIRTARGECLRVTPNHPILTKKGFVPAKDLGPGDNLVCYNAPENRPASVGLSTNNQQEPTRIEDVFHTIREMAKAAHRRLDITAKDFHGDASFFVGEVEIVSLNGELRNESLSFEPVTEEDFVLGSVALKSEASDRTLPINVVGVAPSDLTCSNCGRHLRPLQSLCIGLPTEINALFLESVGQGKASNARNLREGIERFPGVVTSDQVVEILDFNFSGDVYDLQSTSGYIVAQTVVAGNCRCWFEPLIDDVWSELEGMEAQLLADITRGEATARDVPIDSQRTVEKALREHKKVEMDVRFVPRIVDLPEWQAVRREELASDVGSEKAKVLLQGEIFANEVVEWTDSDTGTHYVASQAQEIEHVSTPIARAAAEKLWDGGVVPHAWVATRYREKKASLNATLEVEGYKIYGGQPFPNEIAAQSVRDYFVESYSLYVVQPYILETADPEMYEWLRVEVFGGREFMQRGGIK